LFQAVLSFWGRALGALVRDGPGVIVGHHLGVRSAGWL